MANAALYNFEASGTICLNESTQFRETLMTVEKEKSGTSGECSVFSNEHEKGSKGGGGMSGGDGAGGMSGRDEWVGMSGEEKKLKTEVKVKK